MVENNALAAAQAIIATNSASTAADRLADVTSTKATVQSLKDDIDGHKTDATTQ